MRFATLAFLLCPLLLAPALAVAAPRPSPSQVEARNAELVQAIAAQPGEPAWRYIVIHHTASEHDSLRGISAGHAKRFRDPLGIQYHFLIGNGNSAPDGAIQLARWPHRQLSIHVVHPERAPTAITISLQGNLHERVPSPAQMLAVETLVRHLMALYGIDADRLSSNTNVDGTFTVCPGKYFPFDRLVWRLRHKQSASLPDWQTPLAAVPMDGPWPDLPSAREALRWDRPCREPIPPGPLVELSVLPGREQPRAAVLAIAGGRGCTPISRRFLGLQTPQGWYLRELNGYRVSRLKRQGGRVLVADERGPMQRCRVSVDGPPLCALVAP